MVVQQEDDSRVMMDELEKPECSADVQLPSQGVHTRNAKWREWKRVILRQDA